MDIMDNKYFKLIHKYNEERFAFLDKYAFIADTAEEILEGLEEKEIDTLDYLDPVDGYYMTADRAEQYSFMLSDREEEIRNAVYNDNDFAYDYFKYKLDELDIYWNVERWKDNICGLCYMLLPRMTRFVHTETVPGPELVEVFRRALKDYMDEYVIEEE